MDESKNAARLYYIFDKVDEDYYAIGDTDMTDSPDRFVLKGNFEKGWERVSNYITINQYDMSACLHNGEIYILQWGYGTTVTLWKVNSDKSVTIVNQFSIRFNSGKFPVIMSSGGRLYIAGYDSDNWVLKRYTEDLKGIETISTSFEPNYVEFRNRFKKGDAYYAIINELNQLVKFENGNFNVVSSFQDLGLTQPSPPDSYYQIMLNNKLFYYENSFKQYRETPLLYNHKIYDFDDNELTFTLTKTYDKVSFSIPHIIYEDNQEALLNYWQIDLGSNRWDTIVKTKRLGTILKEIKNGR